MQGIRLVLLVQYVRQLQPRAFGSDLVNIVISPTRKVHYTEYQCISLLLSEIPQIVGLDLGIRLFGSLRWSRDNGPNWVETVSK